VSAGGAPAQLTYWFVSLATVRHIKPVDYDDDVFSFFRQNVADSI
jgi:hypothetical protein